MLVDVHSGRILQFLDTNQYAIKKVVGSIYPVSDDECCPDGCADVNIPATYMQTTQGVTNYGGMYDYSSGTTCTSLDGQYVVLGTDNCMAVNECSDTGDVIHGGTK